jgi:hypothetical protein
MPPALGHYGFDPSGPVPMGPMAGPAQAPLMPAPPVDDPLADGPPPGTLGRTYLVPTEPVPDDKHPRVGMLKVTVPKGYAAAELARDPRFKLVVSVRDDAGHFKPLKGFLGEDGIWQFESEPLYPGIPHIYEVRADIVRVDTVVEARYGREIETEKETKVRTVAYRWVRLVMGRIVELGF